MKKKIIVCTLVLALLISSFSFLNVSAAKATLQNWKIYCSEIDGDNYTYFDDEEFDISVDANGRIDVDAPQGWWPAMLAVKNDKVAIDGIEVKYGSTIKDAGWGGHGFNVGLLSAKITDLPEYRLFDGLAGAIEDQDIDNGIKGVEIQAHGENDGASTKLGRFLIWVYGVGRTDENGNALSGINDRKGYYFTSLELPAASEYTFTLVPDDTYGYVININGVEFRTDDDGDTVDLNVLKELTDGAYLSIGAFTPGDNNTGGMSITSVNGVSAEAPNENAPTSSEPAPSKPDSSITINPPAENKGGCGNKA